MLAVQEMIDNVDAWSFSPLFNDSDKVVRKVAGSTPPSPQVCNELCQDLETKMKEQAKK